MTLIIVFVIVLLQFLYSWAITSGSAAYFAAAIIGVITAFTWLLWKEKSTDDKALQRKRWHITLATSFLGVVFYVVFAVFAAKEDVSGLSGLGLTVNFIWILPAIFGISGLVSKLIR